MKALAEARLAARALLDIAEGRAPHVVSLIPDVEELPLLPESHKDYGRRLADRKVAQTLKASHNRARFVLWMKALTEVYALLDATVEEVAPGASRGLRELCSLEVLRETFGQHRAAPLFLPIRCWLTDTHGCTST